MPDLTATRGPAPAGIPSGRFAAAMPTRRGAGLAVLVGLLYLGLGIATEHLVDQNAAGAPWWPAAGLTFGVLCVASTRDWPPVLAAVFAADLTVSLTVYDVAPAAAVTWAAANTLEPLIGAVVLRRLMPGRWPRLMRIEDVGRFVAVAALAGPPIASLVGATGSVLFLDQPLWPVWPRWYVGDVLGILVVAPVVFAAPEVWRGLRRPPFVAVMLVVAAVTLLVFAPVGGVLSELPYLVTPTLLVAALLHGPAGAAAAGLIVASVANALSGLGHGPFALSGGDTEPLVVLQIFVASQVLTALLIAALSTSLVSSRGLAERLSVERLTDPLTGLGNRLLLDRALDGLAPDRSRHGGSVAVLFSDLDDFKHVNDELGHDVGDRVLQVTGTRLVAAVRPTDVVVRLGGDEFAVVCRDVSREEAEALAARLRHTVESPISVDGRDVVVGVSVGVRWATLPVAEPHLLLRESDREMYRVKRARRDGGGRR